MSDSYEQCFEKNLGTEFDSGLGRVEGLTWLPWVGREYMETRILIAAESHYTNKNDKEAAEFDKQKITAQPRYTRDVIAEYPIAGKVEAGWSSPTFDNLHRLLVSDSLNADIPRRAVLWRNLAYMNIVQRPMWYSREYKERPEFRDFQTGWRVVMDVIRMLSPAVCIFAGLEAAKSFNASMEHLGLTYAPIQYRDAIGRCRPREASCSINGNLTSIVFIRHPSQYFSWRYWQDFVFGEDRQQIKENLDSRVFP